MVKILTYIYPTNINSVFRTIFITYTLEVILKNVLVMINSTTVIFKQKTTLSGWENTTIGYLILPWEKLNDTSLF
ncbi:hypothetical protein AB832_03055 [Flavobacteriaceae bacterium (ex Bugula neritina AB1)]|nr:hypothetical protein AB832_03055 [Flavobacteriaceae bacterium (ex Bugula neritina AB1)]